MSSQEILLEEKEGFLKGKVALVTGGDGGIGWGVCTEFAKEGARVAIVDIDPVKGKEVLGLVKKISPDHHFYQIDVRQIELFGGLLEKIEKEMGGQYLKPSNLQNLLGLDNS